MRKAVTISAIVVISAIVFLVNWYSVTADQDRGRQLIEKYVDRLDHSADKVKLHLALQLLTRTWNAPQQTIILRALHNRADVNEAEVAANFTREDAGAVFYNPGSVDISDLKTVYALAAGKSAFVHSWTAGRMTDLWRMNIALGFVRFDLTPAKEQFLIEFAGAIPTITRENAAEWDNRAAGILSRDEGRALLTTIGPAICPGATARLGKKGMSPTCVCTTSAGNWSCNDTCHGAGSCTVDPGNCGILWLYDCTGMCNNGDVEISSDAH